MKLNTPCSYNYFRLLSGSCFLYISPSNFFMYTPTFYLRYCHSCTIFLLTIFCISFSPLSPSSLCLPFFSSLFVRIRLYGFRLVYSYFSFSQYLSTFGVCFESPSHVTLRASEASLSPSLRSDSP